MLYYVIVALIVTFSILPYELKVASQLAAEESKFSIWQRVFFYSLGVGMLWPLSIWMRIAGMLMENSTASLGPVVEQLGKMVAGVGQKAEPPPRAPRPSPPVTSASVPKPRPQPPEVQPKPVVKEKEPLDVGPLTNEEQPASKLKPVIQVQPVPRDPNII